MTTPELLEFIRIEHALGMSLSEIAKLLISEGEWDMADVAEAFRALGLPEEAVESFSATPNQVVSTKSNIQSETKNVESEIVYHAPKPEMVKGPASTQFKQRPAPMHYVEQPEEPKKPTLARPASLKGQVSRNLVRTVSTASSYAKVEKPKNIPADHHTEAPYISKIATSPSSNGLVGLSDDIGAKRPKQKDVSGPIEQIQNVLSIGLGSYEEEPKPKNVSAPISTEKKKAFDVSKLHIGENGEVVSEEVSPVVTKIENLKTEIETKPKEDIAQAKTEEATPTFNRVEEKPLVDIKPTEDHKEPEVAKPTVEQAPVLKVEQILPKVEHAASVDEKKDVIESPVVKALEPSIPKVEEKIETAPSASEQMKAIEEATARFMKVSEKVEEKKEEKIAPISKVEEKKEEVVSPIVKVEEKPVEPVKPEVKNEPPLFVRAGEPIPEEVKVAEVKPEVKVEENVSPAPVAPIVNTTQAQPGFVAPQIQAQSTPEMQTNAPLAQAQPYGQMPPQQMNQPYGAPWQAAGGQMPPQMQNQMQMPYPNMYGNQQYGMPPQMQQPYYPQPPQPVYAQPPQIIIAPPTSPEPKSMMSHEPRTEEIGSVAPDVEEQAYLAQFGQAKMPEGIVRPQPTVISPTIIYTQQVVAPSAQTQVQPEEEKKPEPMRFDMGKVRTSRKMDQTSYSDRPSIISAVSGMEPVESKSIEDTFKESGEMIKASDIPTTAQSKDVITSLKVPFKRTMISDMAKLEEGILPGQVVVPSTKEGESNLIQTPQIDRVVEEEPLPPPPPKKANKSVLVITLGIIGTVLLGGAVAYYLIVLRLPSAKEVYDNAMKVLVRGPAVSYNVSLAVAATSTDAEPEYLNTNGKATGTLSISSKAFLKGKHYVDFSINHSGIPEPMNFKFNGTVYYVDDEIFVMQNSPSQGTQIENILKEGEWLKAPYQKVGEILGLATSKTVDSGEYGNITPTNSLFKILVTNSPVVVNGELAKFTENGREMYRIPIKLDPKKAVLDTDLLGKYLRGTGSNPTSASRALILEKRYDVMTGELVVDKLLMRPLRMSLEGKFDPAKMPLSGNANLSISFEFQNQDPTVEAKGKSLDDIKALRLEESMSATVIAKDAPVKTIIPVITLALKQYGEKFGRYPLALNDLVLAGFLGEGAITNELSTKIFYSSYVEKPKDTVSGVRCTAKNVKCGFYHLGANLEFKKSTELENDADFITSQINGSDEVGCHNESNMSCFDTISELQKGN